MRQQRTYVVGAVLFAVLIAIGLRSNALQEPVAAQARNAQAPTFEADYQWPKPLGNHWILGSVTGVFVDARDHVWVTHRGVESLQTNEKGPELTPPASSCCFAAPLVLEFDAAGTLVGKWGGKGQGFDWPLWPGGITGDAQGNIYVSGNQPGHVDGRPDAPAPAGRGAAAPGGPVAPPSPQSPQDAHIIKFTRAGQFVWQLGKPTKVEGPEGKTTLSRPTGMFVDNAAKELYIADFGNRRVVVADTTTGAYKRHWGAYGEKPDDAVTLPPYDPNAPPARQFRGVTCVKVSKDGMVYVCDRLGDRIQVFKKDGTFVKEAFVSKTTTGDGSVWDLAFSNDAQQRFLYVADGHDKKVFVLQRDTLDVVTSFGDGGRRPGYFYAVGSIAVDSKGNVFTGENYEGKRVQKFVYKGMAAVPGK